MGITTKEYDVFLSYAHADGQGFAFWLENELRRSGLSVFIDTAEVLLGDELIDKIATAIHRSAYFVILMTPKYFESGWCKKEMFQVLTKEANESNSVVLPILALPTAVPPHLSSKVWFTLEDGNWRKCLESILARVQRDNHCTGNRAPKSSSQAILPRLDISRDHPWSR
jgi:hypothetical protein